MQTASSVPKTSAPLRIIQVVNVRWFNATAWYGLFLASLLRGAGHEVRVLGLGGTESFARAEAWGLAPEAFPLDASNPASVAAAYAGLRRLVRDFDPHIVNCHRGELFFLWALLKRSANFALVRTRGDQRPPKANAVNAFLHAKLADAVIATSSGIAAGVRERLRVPADRVHTIVGGVDTRRFYPDADERAAMRAALGLHGEHRAVGLVGRFDAVKGQKELVGAFALLCRELGTEASGLRLVLAGFPTPSVSGEAVRTWAREAGIADQVIFPGRCENVRALMNALDLGVVASLGSETIARVALEIMACGVPLVGTAVGVMPDLLEGALLVPPGDREAMTALLRRFVTEAAFGGELARAQAKRMASLRESDFYARTMAVYRQVIGAASRNT